MDDVDRLFQCFKCGASPPLSAKRESRSEKRKLKERASLLMEASPGSDAKNIKPRVREKFSPGVFYGSPNGVPPKRPARLLRLLREIRVDLAQQHDLREKVWSTFPKQVEAMKFMKLHTNARIFSYQDHMTGQRRFLVSNYKEFWQRYKEMDSKFRRHYEVIQEALPCHLYFDLEFNKAANAGRDGDEMVDLLIDIMFDVLYEKYDIHRDEDYLIELDSSTEEKFSRHLIIRLPKIAFKDNSHVGAFVAELLSRIQSNRQRDGKWEKLFISKEPSCAADGQCQIFVDAAVYTRNRCFRLPFSSKAGKNSFLVPTGRFKCKNMSEEEVFMASLICNIDDYTEKLLICKMDLDCVKTLHFETEIASKNQKLPLYRPSRFDPSNAPTYSNGKSPFPSLDEFVEAIASTGNISGKIKAWYWFSEDAVMVYSMSRNRYCERIGREHKSNHVIYVIDLRKMAYYQKCHDPDCRGYRSPLRPLPEHILPHLIEDDQSIHNNVQEIPTESSDKEDWWKEAVKVAEQIENMKPHKALDANQMVI